MLKDKLLSYIKEKTREIDFQAVDNSCTADAMSGIFGVKRNTVSHYLNQELGKSLFKVNTRPVLFFSVKEFEQRFFPVEKSVYVSLDELFEQKKTQNQDQVRGEKDPLDRMIGARGSLKKSGGANQDIGILSEHQPADFSSRGHRRGKELYGPADL